MMLTSVIVAFSLVANAPWSTCSEAARPIHSVPIDDAEHIFSAKIVVDGIRPSVDTSTMPFITYIAPVLHGWKNTPASPAIIRFPAFAREWPQKGDKLIFFATSDGEAVVPIRCSLTYYETALYERAILGKPEFASAPWQRVDLNFLRSALERLDTNSAAADALKRLPGGIDVLLRWAESYSMQGRKIEEVEYFLSLLQRFPDDLSAEHRERVAMLALSPRGIHRSPRARILQLALLASYGSVDQWFSKAEYTLGMGDEDSYMYAIWLMVSQLENPTYADDAENALRKFAERSDAARLERSLIHALSFAKQTERGIRLLCEYGTEDACDKAKTRPEFPRPLSENEKVESSSGP